MKKKIDLYLKYIPYPYEALSEEFELKFKIDTAMFINYYSNLLRSQNTPRRRAAFAALSLIFSQTDMLT